MKIEIKLADKSNLCQIKECVELSYRPYVEKLTVEPAPLHADYEDLILNDSVYILEGRDKEMLGLVVLISEPNCLLVDNISIFPKWQRRGTLPTVCSFIIARALSLNMRSIRAITNSKLDRNIEMYTKIGLTIDRYEEMVDRTAVHMSIDMENIGEVENKILKKILSIGKIKCHFS
jgi:hypothetical protein